MRNYENITYFVNKLKEGKIHYEDGKLFRGDREIKGSKRSKGNYLHLSTTLKGKHFASSFHCVIFAYFHGVEELKKHETIDHKDGDKYNNRIENLEGTSVRDNNLRYAKNNYQRFNTSNEKVNLIKRLLADGDKMTRIAEFVNCDYITVYKIKENKLGVS